MRPGLCFIIGLVLASVFGRQDKSTIQVMMMRMRMRMRMMMMDMRERERQTRM
jgi:hypothetical protein